MLVMNYDEKEEHMHRQAMGVFSPFLFSLSYFLLFLEKRWHNCICWMMMMMTTDDDG